MNQDRTDRENARRLALLAQAPAPADCRVSLDPRPVQNATDAIVEARFQGNAPPATLRAWLEAMVRDGSVVAREDAARLLTLAPAGDEFEDLWPQVYANGEIDHWICLADFLVDFERSRRNEWRGTVWDPTLHSLEVLDGGVQ